MPAEIVRYNTNCVNMLEVFGAIETVFQLRREPRLYLFILFVTRSRSYYSPGPTIRRRTDSRRRMLQHCKRFHQFKAMRTKETNKICMKSNRNKKKTHTQT